MHKQPNKRRRFIKAGLVAPILGSLTCNSHIVNAVSGNAAEQNSFDVPQKIHDELVKIYGAQAGRIKHADSIVLKAPDIAENGAVVPVTVSGEKGTVSSIALFVDKNPKVLATTCRFYEGSDLSVSTRVKIGRSSDIYLIAQTDSGLVGVKKPVKVTIGCGGG